MVSYQGDAARHRLPWKLLCLVVGFSVFKSFEPVLAYTNPYLVKWKGLTNFQVTNKVLPVLSYGSFIWTILAAPACEYLSYRTVNNICNFVLVAGALILRYGKTLILMQTMEAIAAMGVASVGIFQAYLFFFIPKSDFQKMTSINQASNGASLFLSAELGQILVSCGFSYNILADIYIAAEIVTLIIGFLLPKDHQQTEKTSLPKDLQDTEEARPVLINFFSKNQGIWSSIKDTWQDQHLQILSFWWAASVAGQRLSLNYATNLFEGISSNTQYNGQIMASATACGSLAALSAIYLRKFVAKSGDIVYIVGSIVYGMLCITAAFSKSLWTAYPAYIIMAALEKLLICLVFAQCGSLVKNERYMLLFSFNGGMALLLMALLQGIFEIMELDVFSQYTAVGCYFMVIAVIFSILYGISVYHSSAIKMFSSGDKSSDERAPISIIHSYDQPLILSLDTNK